MILARRCSLFAIACLLPFFGCGIMPRTTWAAPEPLVEITSTVPSKVAECTPERLARLEAAAEQFDRWSSNLAWNLPEQAPDVVAAVQSLLEAKAQVADALDRCLQLRSQFIIEARDSQGRRRIRCYLQITGQYVDLLGRIRYTLRDAIDNAAYALENDLTAFQSLLNVLTASADSVAASVMSYVLFDPLPETELKPFSDEVKLQVLQLVAASRSEGLVDELADFLEQPTTSPRLKLAAADVLRQIGLPQDPRSEETIGEDPPPAIVAAELFDILQAMDSSALANGDRQLHHDLLEWLSKRMTEGITEPMLRVGSIEVKPGDWLLQRNPSPYNRFTDISPGLFTHIAIVTEEVDDQGKRRIVAVDMPERSAHVPATNAETFLGRSLHYMVLRPRDASTAIKLAATAAETIGNEAQFDLEFRTDRMPIKAGQSLRGQRMHSYCAGFVLACAEAAGFRREAFFPIEENPSSDLCQANLRKLGLSLGDRFVSPTGPLFSEQFTIVGQREPMYDPGREIKEAIYDHFAEGMAQRSLNPSPDLFQALRLRAAQLSRTHAWLARALAQANGVSPEMDLESAARAAAVVETLDAVANEGWHTFEQARTAIMAGTDDEFSAAAFSAEQRELFERLRREHSELLRDWLEGRLSPRDVRVRLVQYYAAAGRRRIDERFF